MSKISTLTLVVVCLLAGPTANAQQNSLSPYYPTHKQVLEAYDRANKLDTVIRKLPLVTSIRPNWQADSRYFWYSKPTTSGAVYQYVDATTGAIKKVFDNEKIAQAIGKVTGTQPDATKLTITKMLLSNDAQHITFKTNNTWLQCDLRSYQCSTAKDTGGVIYDSARPLQRSPSRWERARGSMQSPDKQWVAEIKEGNLLVKAAAGGVENQLTTDGSLAKPYGSVSWSPDGKHIVAYHIDPKETKKVYNLLTSVANTTRAELLSREYAQPGDDMTSYEMYIFDVAAKSKLKIDAEKIDFFGAPRLHWREGDNRYFTYEKVDRGHQRFRVIEADAQTGKTRNVIDEKTPTFIYEQRIYTRYLPATHEIVWITEKDGWRHIYLVNEITGKEKLVTKGNWVVRDIDSVDTKKREIWFKASGMNAGEDPYYLHSYRIGFDGSKLTPLTSEIGNHTVTYSPDRKYYIDTYSQVNVAPVINLRRTADGKKIVELEHPDIASLLATGVKLPQIFISKARDGVTDIYGIVSFPSKMEPGKSYPVIENIYAGPQDSFVPKNFLPFSEMQSMAELGFIVVQVDGLGTANRSKKFHDVCWHNLADAGLPDRILWMKAMAQKYPQADISRVGVYGTSAGGQNSTGALLFHPEFYKAAVSACGCHDNRIDKQWWNEQWMGYPVGPHYGEQSNITNAAKLQGSLMLIVGEADSNVPPESTYRLADALIKAGKDFDFLTIPGMGHSDGGPYGRRRKRDFFVKHLLNAEPPTRNTTELTAMSK